MCGCKKNPAQAKAMKLAQEEELALRIKETEEKMNNGEELTVWDVCPYCKKNKRYWCRKWCVLQKDQNI